MFTAEIRAAGLRQNLGTFLSAEEAGRAYDAVAWVLRRPHRTLNFQTIETLEVAVFLAKTGPDRLVTADQRRRHRQTQRRIRNAQEDERAMAAFRRDFPQHFIAEQEFYAQKRAERRAARAERRVRCEERRARHREIRARRQFSIEQLRHPTISWEDPRMTDFRLSSPSATLASSSGDSDFE